MAFASRAPWSADAPKPVRAPRCLDWAPLAAPPSHHAGQQHHPPADVRPKRFPALRRRPQLTALVERPDHRLFALGQQVLRRRLRRSARRPTRPQRPSRRLQRLRLQQAEPNPHSLALPEVHPLCVNCVRSLAAERRGQRERGAVPAVASRHVCGWLAPTHQLDCAPCDEVRSSLRAMSQRRETKPGSPSLRSF